jgi:peptide/nickel transport system substrate-binding protein
MASDFYNVKRFFCCGLVMASLLICSCTGQHSKKSYKVFRYNESKGIPTLDPAFARNQSIIWPVCQLYNGLVQFDDSLNVKPSLSYRWEITEQGRLYRFFLRKDVYFHSDSAFAQGIGRKLVANDVVYSLLRVIDKRTASPGSWIFNNVDTARVGFTKGFRAPSDSVVEIALRTPFPAFLGILAMPYCLVVPHEAVERYGNDFRRHPVGTGPFCLKYWKEGEKLVMVRNSKYFEKDASGVQLPYIDGVAISFVSDKQSEFMEFIKGNLDFISGVNPGFKDELITRSGQLNPKYQNRIKMITLPYLNTEYLGFLCDSTLPAMKSSPLNSVKVRQAINYGFDRRKMMLYLRNNLGTPAEQGFVPLGMPSFSTEVHGYTYNIQKAKELLEQAGFPNGNGLPVITLMTTSDYLDLCEYIQHELEKIGIRINIEISTGATYREMVANNKLPFFRGSWVADYADAENYLALFYGENFSPAGPNFFHFSNKAFNELYRQAMQEPSDVKRCEMYRLMDQIVIDNSVVVPLFYDKVVRFTSNRVSGFAANPMNLLMIKLLKIDDK